MQYYLAATPDWLLWKKEPKKLPQERTKPNQSLHIAFITQFSRARELKLAYAANMYGHRVTLIAHEVQFPELVDESFDGFHQTGNVWQMLKVLDDINPDIVHLFINYNNAHLLPILYHSPSPVIYDPYDCLKGMFKPAYQAHWAELYAERLNFKHADHVCSRSLEPLYLRRTHGYRMSDTTYFAEYCWQEPTQKEPRKIDSDDDLHIVYVGGIWPEDRYSPREFGYAQFLDIGRELNSRGLHLHLYPAPTPANLHFEDFFSRYLDEDKKNHRFHIHKPLPYHELLSVLPSYDAALHIVRNWTMDGLGRASEVKQKYSFANKLSDYIEAGLPIIIHNGFHQAAYVRHYGKSITFSGLNDFDLLSKRIKDIRSKRIIPNRCSTVRFQAKRLSNMYHHVLEKRSISLP
jgi:glycosyltransferase involved in cell wall biosynthesis